MRASLGSSNNLSRSSGGYACGLLAARPSITRMSLRALLAIVVSTFVSLPLIAATPLFDKPLHLTRSVEDSLSNKPATLDEYYLGNRAVTVSGDRTVIVDYDKSEITEIDRASATYSITSFADVAKATTHRVAVTQTSKPVATRSGSDSRAGRTVDVFSADDRANSMHAVIAIDPSVSLSREAFDVIVGAAYPKDGSTIAELSRSAAHRRSLQALSVGSSSAPETFGLPLEQSVSVETPGETVTATNRVTRIGDEQVAPELITVPAGAKRVESRLLQAQRLAEEVDALPRPPAHR